MDYQSGSGKLFATVTIYCDTCKGKDELRFLGEGFNEKYVQVFAGLIDGTAYPSPPGPESQIGKCVKGHPVRTTIQFAVLPEASSD